MGQLLPLRHGELEEVGLSIQRRLQASDSGVGLDHAEPTIPCYRVTTLRDLLVRILASELGGRRIEAGQVLREVGSYAGGVCRG